MKKCHCLITVQFFLSINKIAALIITGLYLYNGFQIFLFLRSTGASTVANQKENATE